MSLMQALKRHIPSAADFLAGVSPSKKDVSFSFVPRDADFICSYGVSASLYNRLRAWLDEDLKRRLVFVEDDPEALALLLQEEDAILLLNDLRVKLYFLESPLQVEGIAKKIAWSAVFLKMQILNLRNSSHFEHFRQMTESTHLAADLLLSDGADWGCSAMRHAKQNLSESYGSGLDLSFPQVPAIVVGAGPSLEINGRLLEKLQNRALIFAGGNALNRLSVTPHFAAAIDKEESVKFSFPKVPLLFQARVHSDLFSQRTGKALIFPDNHFSFLNWLIGEERFFDGGWTVGNFLTAVALRWGCDPIVFIGMDYCYRGNQKYAQGPEESRTGLIEAFDTKGQAVLTQRDWLMAIQWTEELAKKHPDRHFLNATEGGMKFLSSIKLQDLHLKKIPHLQEKIENEIRHIPIQSIPPRFEEWKQSLIRCRELPLDCEEEIAHRLLLQPLWNIWKPVFERELDLDPHKINPREKMRINETLFYQQVIQEHLDVL